MPSYPPAGECDTVDADSVIAALETNGFHFSDVPLGSHFYIKVGGQLGQLGQ